MADEMVSTREVTVRVFMRNGTTVEGLAHIHVGDYERRVSDILNVSPPNFLPITEATCHDRDGESYDAETVLVNSADIVMLMTAADEARPIGDDVKMPRSSL